jgi:hypothetical protein
MRNSGGNTVGTTKTANHIICSWGQITGISMISKELKKGTFCFLSPHPALSRRERDKNPEAKSRMSPFFPHL